MGVVVALVFWVVFLAVPCLFARSVAAANSELAMEWSWILEYAPVEGLKSESRMSDFFEKRLHLQGKDYGGVVAEKERRFLNFKDNLRYLVDAAHGNNKKKKNAPHYWQRLSKFADLSNQEFSILYMGKKKQLDSTQKVKRAHTRFRQADVGAALHIDGVDKDGVKEQGDSWGGMSAAQLWVQHTKVSKELKIMASSSLRRDVVKLLNGTELQLFPSIETHHHEHVNETRRRLGDFQQCSPCTCCD